MPERSPSDEFAITKGWARHLPDHLGLVSSLALLIIASVRLMAVAGFDLATATALIAYTDAPVILFSTLLLCVFLVPVLAVYGLPLLWTSRWLRSRRRPRRVEVVIFWVSLILSAMLVPWRIVVFLVAGTLVASGLWAGIEWGIRTWPRVLGGGYAQAVQSMERVLIGAVSLLAAFMVLFAPTGWMVKESVTRVDMPAFTAYVLEDSENGLVVLRYDTRRIERVPRDQVLSREICVSTSSDVSTAGRTNSPSVGSSAWIEADRRTLGAVLFVNGSTGTYPLCPR
jgi:hypothetical protein